MPAALSRFPPLVAALLPLLLSVSHALSVGFLFIDFCAARGRQGNLEWGPGPWRAPPICAAVSPRSPPRALGWPVGIPAEGVLRHRKCPPGAFGARLPCMRRLRLPRGRLWRWEISGYTRRLSGQAAFPLLCRPIAFNRAHARFFGPSLVLSSYPFPFSAADVCARLVLFRLGGCLFLWRSLAALGCHGRMLAQLKTRPPQGPFFFIMQMGRCRLPVCIFSSIRRALFKAEGVWGRPSVEATCPPPPAAPWNFGESHWGKDKLPLPLPKWLRGLFFPVVWSSASFLSSWGFLFRTAGRPSVSRKTKVCCKLWTVFLLCGCFLPFYLFQRALFRRN